MREFLRDGARDDLLDRHLQTVAQFRREPRHHVVQHGRHAAADLVFQYQLDAVLQPVEHARDEAFLEGAPGVVVELARRGLPGFGLGFGRGCRRGLGHEPEARLAFLQRAFGGALVSTSANPHGQPPARLAQTVANYFGDALDGLLDAPLGGQTSPTVIRDALSGTIIRA